MGIFWALSSHIPKWINEEQLYTMYVEHSVHYCKFHISLTLNQPGSAKSVNYRGPFSFGLAFTRCKLTSPGRRQMCNRALRFWQFGQNGAAILLYLDRARPDWESASPLTLCGPGREIDRNVPGAARHCGPWPGRTSPALWWSVLTVKPVGSGEVGMVAPRQNFWQKNVKMDVKMDVKTSFFDVMSEVQKDSQDISAGLC